MKTRFFTIAAAAIPITLAVASGTAQAQITFDTANAAANGEGCTLRNGVGDTEVIQSGNSVAILFRNMGVDLPAGGPDRRLADRNVCSVRIPVTVSEGFLVTQLTQTLTYGVNKTRLASGTITTLDSFIGSSIGGIRLRFAEGPVLSEPLLTETRSRNIRIDACRGPKTGLYRSDVGVTGERRNADRETVILQASAQDIIYEIRCSVSSC
jgi:hypothetical protein